MRWFKPKPPTLAQKIEAALARAQENAYDARNQADYYQALADLNEHQATAAKHRAMAEFNDALVDRYRAELDLLKGSVTTATEEPICLVQDFTQTAPSVSSIAFGLRRTASASSRSSGT